MMESHEVDLEICECCSVFEGDFPDLTYHHTKVLLRGADDEYFFADFPERLDVEEIDIKKLNIIKIPEEHIWPLADPNLTQAPDPLPVSSYQKRPQLLNYDGTEEDHDFLPRVVLNEAKACEILRKHPHPNIARYLGCIIKDGRIKGLIFDKYPVTLYKMLEDETPFDKERCIRGIEAGVQHMHDLGLVHNDLNPANIMMDGDNPVIIDFDSCKPEGEKLLKGGTFEWSTDEAYSKRSNDHYSLSKIREAIFGSGDEGKEIQEDGQGLKHEGDWQVKEVKEAKEVGENQNGSGGFFFTRLVFLILLVVLFPILLIVLLPFALFVI
ncbi:serine/threonine kinase [Xylaria flabelliformis]|nr:serine/threonine kinase [Xylaria flabelliformis]